MQLTVHLWMLDIALMLILGVGWAMNESRHRYDNYDLWGLDRLLFTLLLASIYWIVRLALT